MKARELQSYLRSLDGGWMDVENTVDTFKSGDPETEVRGIAVAWMSFTWALQQAVELRCNVFITHEPTYYNHHDDDPWVFRFAGVREKERFIKENELIIIRCHDPLDQMPDIGIPDSWAQFLGLGNPIDREGYFRVYDVSGRTAVDVARQVAEHTQHLGQAFVQLIGPADNAVTRVSIGTGAITPYLSLIDEYQVDLAICTDDGIAYWRDGAFAIDMGIPLIVVNHPVSEEAGMINLAQHLRTRLPDIPVHHIPQRCMYGLVSSVNGNGE